MGLRNTVLIMRVAESAITNNIIFFIVSLLALFLLFSGPSTGFAMSDDLVLSLFSCPSFIVGNICERTLKINLRVRIQDKKPVSLRREC
jgi:hypothetical protein